jgi:signal peptidase II
MPDNAPFEVQFRESIDNLDWRKTLKKYLLDYAQLFMIAGIVIALDQLTKYLVRTNVPMNTVYRPDLWLSQYARIVHVNNSGAAFGMFRSLGNVFSILSVGVGLVILYYFPQVPRKEWYLRIAMGLLLGGAIGNLIDRLLFQGHVTDFISLGNFPVFNVADSSISCGVAILFLVMWFQERQKKNQPGEEIINDEPVTQTATPSTIPEDPQGER